VEAGFVYDEVIAIAAVLTGKIKSYSPYFAEYSGPYSNRTKSV